MTTHDVRWAIVAGAGYVFLVLFWYANYQLGRMEANGSWLREIVATAAPE